MISSTTDRQRLETRELEGEGETMREKDGIGGNRDNIRKDKAGVCSGRMKKQM